MKCLKLIILLPFLSFLSLVIFAQEKPDTLSNKKSLPAGFQNLQPQEKVKWLLQNMSFAEKLEQLNTSPKSSPPTYQQNRNERLHIPGFVSLDGPRGAKRGAEKVVCFPIALAMASTWDTVLMQHVGNAFADQLKHLKANQLFSPGVNIIKHPQEGRNSEYFSEDPYLAGVMGAAEIKGIQQKGCIATPKHFACNSFESGRFRVNINVTDRVLREIYLPAFKRCVEQGGAKSLMTAYNSINGHYASANKQLLDILYKEWGFQGYVVSDYNAEMESAEAAMNAGTHIEMPGWKCYNEKNIKSALEKNKISDSLLEIRLTKILQIKTDPWFYDPYSSSNDPYNVEEQRNLAREVATKSMVLLKNENNTLPINTKQSVALIGPFANSEIIIGNQGSSSVMQERSILLYDALSTKLNKNLLYAKGCETNTDEKTPFFSDFKCKAEYFNNLDCQGNPAITRDENSILKLSFSGSGSAAKVEGIKKTALGFSGQASVKLCNLPAYKSNENFTWSFWTYLPDQFPDKDAPIISSFLWNQIDFELTPTRMKFFLRDPARITVQIDAEIPAQHWTHIIIQRSGDKINLYMDGELKGSKELKVAIPSAPLFLGGNILSTKNANCSIDEIALYSRALDEKEIKKLANKEEIEENRVFYQNCDDNSNIGSITETYTGITNFKNMSARWKGTFTANKTGKYCFVIASNSGVRFFVDNKKIYDEWQEKWIEGVFHRCWIQMEQGKTYNLTVEYSNVFDKQRNTSGFIKFEYALPQNTDSLFADAIAAAKKQDAAIVVAGVQQRTFQGEANDAETYELTSLQDELIKAVAKANPKTIVVLCSAGGVNMQSWINTVPAIMEAYFPGQEAGYAITDLLFGDVNPSGKLTVTYPVTTDQLEVEAFQTEYEKSVCSVGYRMFDKRHKTPMFPFGHGLSYTTFSYSNLKINKTSNMEIEVSFRIANTGAQKGAEVAQLYIGQLKCQEERPVRELKGFSKVEIEAGQTKDVTIKVPHSEFMFYSDNQKKWILEPGDFTIEIGSSSRDIRLKETINVN